MGITRQSLATDLKIKFTFPKLYPDTEFVFPCHAWASKEVLNAQRELARLPAEERDEKSPALNVETLSHLLNSEPEGFDDFPKDARPLAQRAREFFTGEGLDETEKQALQIIVNAALTGYWNALQVVSH